MVKRNLQLEEEAMKLMITKSTKENVDPISQSKNMSFIKEKISLKKS